MLSVDEGPQLLQDGLVAVVEEGVRVGHVVDVDAHHRAHWGFTPPVERHRAVAQHDLLVDDRVDPCHEEDENDDSEDQQQHRKCDDAPPLPEEGAGQLGADPATAAAHPGTLSPPANYGHSALLASGGRSPVSCVAAPARRPTSRVAVMEARCGASPVGPV